ncbi:hypothetical protein M9H77_09905 [Catharanthus roseus]|uniref:Uncharacterized protein n=1 Tax=Catharanthus roseus TaxID=4058 RepID=A0ACC0C238_CATRO|nr:hypothetical protein M9H77_09905 [Catharanthus roseus]
MGRWRASLSLNLSRIVAITKFNYTPAAVPPHKLFNFNHYSIPRTQFFNLRRFSALPSPIPQFVDDFDYGTHQNLDNNYPLDKEDAAKIPIKAYFLCTSINLKSLQAEQSRNFVSPTSRSSNSIAFRFCNSPSATNEIQIRPPASSCRYMVVFQYGSAVLFNVEDHEVEHYMQILRRHASGLLPEMRKDDYAVQEKPLMDKDMQGSLDFIVLKDLDMDSIRIIGSVLGQSVALDHFVSQVDGMVEEFTDINREMEKHGTFTMNRKKLFQLVGKANSNLADVILKVGIFDRSEIAWRDAKYAQIYEYLREEYEVTQRFGNLHFKLKFVEHNIHFLQEVLQNRRSDLLEWVIIVLLTMENFLSIYEIIRESTAGI